MVDPPAMPPPSHRPRAPRDAPADRGRLVIRDRVVNRIACTEALLVDGVVPSSEGFDRVRGRGLPRALAVVEGPDAAVSLRIAVQWPLALAPLTRAVRTRVAERIRELTGLHVSRVDVAVDRIVPDTPPRATGAAGSRRVS